MQAVKDKLHEITAVRKATAEAKAQEKEEKELAQARVEVAKEVRKAREAEAVMDLHANKAGEVARQGIAKHMAYKQEHFSNDTNEHPSS